MEEKGNQAGSTFEKDSRSQILDTERSLWSPSPTWMCVDSPSEAAGAPPPASGSAFFGSAPVVASTTTTTSSSSTSTTNRDGTPPSTMTDSQHAGPETGEGSRSQQLDVAREKCRRAWGTVYSLRDQLLTAEDEVKQEHRLRRSVEEELELERNRGRQFTAGHYTPRHRSRSRSRQARRAKSSSRGRGRGASSSPVRRGGRRTRSEDIKARAKAVMEDIQWLVDTLGECEGRLACESKERREEKEQAAAATRRHQAEIAQLRDELATAERRGDKYKTQTDHYKAEAKTLRDKLTKAERRWDRYMAEKASHKAQVAQERQRKEQEKQQVQAQRAAEQERRKAAQEKKDEERATELSKFKEENGVLRARVEAQQQQLDSQAGLIETLTKELSELRLAADARVPPTPTEEAAGRVADLETTVKELEGDKDGLNQQFARLAGDLHLARSHLNEAKTVLFEHHDMIVKKEKASPVPVVVKGQVWLEEVEQVLEVVLGKAPPAPAEQRKRKARAKKIWEEMDDLVRDVNTDIFLRQNGEITGVDEDNAKLRDLTNKYGEGMKVLFIQKKRELEEYNASGGYPVSVLSDEGHDLTLAEGLRRMLKKMAQTGAYSLNRLPSA